MDASSGADDSQPNRPPGPQAVLSQVLPHLERPTDDPRPIVVMTCGIAGAGKSTLSKGIIQTRPDFTRLSVDTIVRNKHGLYAIDYPADKLEEYQAEAHQFIKSELCRLLEQKKDFILDLSFYNKEYREEYRAIVEPNGGRCVLVYLNADKDLLWKRITERRRLRDEISDLNERDGDSAFNISEEVFEMYCSGFEAPVGEGEIVVTVT